MVLELAELAAVVAGRQATDATGRADLADFAHADLHRLLDRGVGQAVDDDFEHGADAFEWHEAHVLEHDPDARILVVTDRDELDKQIVDVMRDAGVIGSVGVTFLKVVGSVIAGPRVVRRANPH